MSNQDDEIVVGSVVYRFDINRRVYEKNAEGKAVGGPIYREYFRKYYIIGEEGRSWIYSSTPDGPYHQNNKIGKTKAKDVFYSEAEVDRQCWMEYHRYRICRAVELCRDVAKIKAIAEIIGYDGGN